MNDISGFSSEFPDGNNSKNFEFLNLFRVFSTNFNEFGFFTDLSSELRAEDFTRFDLARSPYVAATQLECGPYMFMWIINTSSHTNNFIAHK